MRLSPLFAFVTFALWASACDSVNEYSRRNNSLLRREQGMLHEVEQPLAHNVFISSNNDGRHIYVITFSGRLLRTYDVTSNGRVGYHTVERYYKRDEYNRGGIRYMINSQNRNGKQETCVLTPHGLYTYTVDPGAGYKVQKSHDPNARTLAYYDEVLDSKKKIIREIGLGEKPLRTVFEDTESGQRRIYNLFEDFLSVGYNPYARLSPSVQRQRHGIMEAEQEMVGQPTSYYGYIYWSWVGLKHHIYVIGYNGEPVRTYIMDADERHYIVVDHSHQSTHYTVLFETTEDTLMTNVLGSDFLRISNVKPEKSEQVERVPIRSITYSDEGPDRRGYIRHIGFGGRPIKTVIKNGINYLDTTEVTPTQRPIEEADHIVK